MNRLKILRKRVKNFDRKIIRLINQRLSVVKEIGREKKRLRIPLQDWNVEKGVIDNALRCAVQMNLDENFIRSIFSNIIEQSRVQQEKLHYTAYSGTREDILIIGGLGAMGKWFAYFFQNQGHRVSICDVQKSGIDGFPYYRDLKKALFKKSFVLIATPLGVVPEILRKISVLRFPGVVCDIGSVKSHIIPAIKDAIENNIKITSIHPMFGPACKTLADKVICLCNCGCAQADDKAMNFFRGTAAKIIPLPYVEHDRLISYVLGLSHFINILFIKILLTSGYEFCSLKCVASTTFNSQLVTTRSVVHENPALYYEIQRLNPYQKVIFNQLQKTLNEITKTIQKGNSAMFRKVFEDGSRWLNE